MSCRVFMSVWLKLIYLCTSIFLIVSLYTHIILTTHHWLTDKVNINVHCLCQNLHLFAILASVCEKCIFDWFGDSIRPVKQRMASTAQAQYCNANYVDWLQRKLLIWATANSYLYAGKFLIQPYSHFFGVCKDDGRSKGLDWFLQKCILIMNCGLDWRYKVLGRNQEINE